MGSYCIAEGFYRKFVGWGGSCVSPEPEASKEVYCEKCDVEAKKTRLKSKSSTGATESGGRLKISFDIYKVECLKCGRSGEVRENYQNEDVSYHSCEERRVNPEL